MKKDDTHEQADATLGEKLRTARESKKLSLEAVNRDTKISLVVLKALEQDDFESFESEIYLKGFLRTYARYLGLDVDRTLQSLSRQRGGTPIKGGATWDIEESIVEEKLKSPRIFRRFVLPLLFVLILILIFLYVNERQKVRRLTPGETQGYLETGADGSRLA